MTPILLRAVTETDWNAIVFEGQVAGIIVSSETLGTGMWMSPF